MEVGRNQDRTEKSLEREPLIEAEDEEGLKKLH